MTKKIRHVSDVFKSHLTVKTVYKGGKSIVPKAGQKVYKLSSNENPIGMSPKALDAIKEYSQNLHRYPDNTDIRLRRALAKDFDYQLDVNQFIAASSGSEIIDLLARAFLREGDEVLISTPSFVPYNMFSAWSGATVIDVPLKGKHYELDVEGLLCAINNRTRIIFLTSPNNPTGTYLSKAILDTFLAQVPPDVLIVFDEVYRHFADAEDYVTALPYLKKYPNLVAINSFSKTYGLAAMRVGYCYTSLEVAHYVRQICKPFLIPQLSLEAAIAALKDDEFVKKTVKLVKKERLFLSHSFEQLGIDFLPSQANFFLIEPPIPSDKFVEYLMQAGIMTRPADNFGAKGKVRISIGTREANERLVEVMSELTAGNARIR
ncbi:MAG: histidinol-phosphate transaminase [Bacteroidota bacterium]